MKRIVFNNKTNFIGFFVSLLLCLFVSNISGAAMQDEFDAAVEQQIASGGTAAARPNMWQFNSDINEKSGFTESLLYANQREKLAGASKNAAQANKADLSDAYRKLANAHDNAFPANTDYHYITKLRDHINKLKSDPKNIKNMQIAETMENAAQAKWGGLDQAMDTARTKAAQRQAIVNAANDRVTQLSQTAAPSSYAASERESAADRERIFYEKKEELKRGIDQQYENLRTRFGQ